MDGDLDHNWPLRVRGIIFSNPHSFTDEETEV